MFITHQLFLYVLSARNEEYNKHIHCCKNNFPKTLRFM